jgi:hypothetical protein
MAELPQLVTEPGLSRPFYTGTPRTDAYVTEALRALGDVSIDPSTLSAPLDVNYQDAPSAMPSAFLDNESVVSLGRGGVPGDGDGSSAYRVQYGYDPARPSLGERGDHDLPASQADEYGAFLPQPDARFRSPGSRKPPPASSSSRPSISQGTGLSGPSGGRFATFPTKGMRQDPVGQTTAEPLVGSRSSFEDAEQTFPKGEIDDAAPMYEDIEGTLAPPPGPPPGAAPPAMLHTSPYLGGYHPGSYDSGPSFVPDNSVENEDDTQLPYMSPRERKAPFGSRPLPMPHPWVPPGREAESFEEPHGRAPLTTELDSFRAPTPPAPVEDPDDERALNAAAAREVSRELDSLMYQPPSTPKDLPPEPLAPAAPNTPPAVHSSPRSSIDSVAPTSSPFARARGRVSGSAPVTRGSLERTSPTNGPPSGPPSPLRASAPSSPAQHAQLPPPSIVLARPSSPSLSSINNTSFRTPPELPPSPGLVSSQRSLPQPQGVPFSSGKPPPPPRPPRPPRQGSGMISVAAFRRPAPREPPVNSRDVSPLSIRKKELRGSRGPLSPTSLLPGAQPPELPSLPQEQQQEDEFDYIAAYYSAGGDDTGSPPSYTDSRARSGSLR